MHTTKRHALSAKAVYRKELQEQIELGPVMRDIAAVALHAVPVLHSPCRHGLALQASPLIRRKRRHLALAAAQRTNRGC